MKKVGKTLADGEATGHHHVLQKTEVVELDDGTREFENQETETITHEEHKPIEIRPNQYFSGKVREQDHFADEARIVQD